MSEKVILHLLPNLLSPNADLQLYIPPSVKEIVHRCKGFIGESKKETIGYIKRFQRAPQEVPILLYNEHTSDAEFKDLCENLLSQKGEWGLVSDAGLPLVADPGAKLVKWAKSQGIEFHLYPGPSSIFMALMLSGCSCQSFTFHGYFPYEERDLIKLKDVMVPQIRLGVTQVFIETPYRNMQRLKQVLALFPDEFSLTIAMNLTDPEQKIYTFTIREWKKKEIALGKEPAVFVIGKN
jgi:16S rRNA (cytidine1402-2'-O)-methyltransferase